MSLIATGRVASPGNQLSTGEVEEVVAAACLAEKYRGRRVLVIIPDGTRTAPVGMMFKALHARIGAATSRFDIIVALGTHQPMSEEAICGRLDISLEERRGRYGAVQFFNHEWDNPAALKQVGTVTTKQLEEWTDGRMSMDVPVNINRRVFDYDELIIVGPVFPHEVVGFSGGNKYLFPGISGPEILNVFHWLGALVSNVGIIGNKWTPVRRVVDRVAAMVPVPKLCFSMVVRKAGLAALFAGSPEAAWDRAADVSADEHVEWKDHAYHTILSCAPTMYDELWVGGKCMYKLEPVLADGGELIIYAPHIREISLTHGHLIRQVGYHCKEYFVKQWDRFSHVAWGTLAHCTHVYGAGTYNNGVEKPRARVTLATGIPESVCREINLGYRDPASIRAADFSGRESEGILHVPKAGEQLYKLKSQRGA